MMMRRSRIQPLILGVGVISLLISYGLHAQQALPTEVNEGAKQTQQELKAEEPTLTKTANTITVKTGLFSNFPTAPSFCILRGCSTPSIRLEVNYEDAPRLAEKLRDGMLSKYFYSRQNITEPQEKYKLTQHVSVRTTYKGSVDGYRNQLAINNAETEARDAQDKAAAIVSLVTYFATRGNVQQESSNSHMRVISNKEVSELPAGIKQILVTQVELRTKFDGKDQMLHQNETLTASYEDMDEQELRNINLEDGIKKILRMDP